MRVAELLVEKFDRYKEGSDIWTQIQTMCRDLQLTIVLPNAANPVGHNKQGVNVSGKVRVRRDIKAAKQMDTDERELTLRLFRAQFVKWLKGKQAEGRDIGHTFKKLVKNAEDLTPQLEDGVEDPYAKFDVFIGYPPEGKEELHSTILLSINSYELKDLARRRKHGGGHESVPVVTCTQFSSEEVRNRVRRTLNGAKTSPLAKMKFLLDLAHAMGKHVSKPGFEKSEILNGRYETISRYLTDPLAEDALRAHQAGKFATPLLQTSNERIYNPTDVSEEKFLAAFNANFPGVLK